MGAKQSVESNDHSNNENQRSFPGLQQQSSTSQRRSGQGNTSSRQNQQRYINFPSTTRLERAHSTAEPNTLRIPQQRAGAAGNYDNSSSSSEDESRSSRVFNWLQRRSQPNLSQSLPHYFYRKDAVCSMCGKMIPAEDVEVHFVMCITKPRVSYNEDELTHDAGECSICLEEMEKGDKIARLPCLCVYHIECIEQWFKKSQTCPEHPPD